MLFEISEPNQSSEPHQKYYAIGIDLGTTHSLVACIRNGIAQVLPDEKDNYLMPSAIYFCDDKIYLGKEAKEYNNKNLKYYFSSFKSFMGKNTSDIMADNLLNIIDYNSKSLTFNVPNQEKITPVQLSAIILKSLKQRAIESIQGKFMGAVITVPAYFNEAQRQATKDAAKLADIEVLRLINEPTAAALAYGLNNNSQGYYAVYDLGGGTFDISILDIQGEVFEILATNGNTALGGDDFDTILAQYILEKSGQNIHISKIKSIARNIKHQLSNEKKYTYTYVLNNQAHDLIITQDIFNQLTKPLIDKTINLLIQAIKDAKINLNQLEGIILVGGSTRMQCVKQSLEQILPNKILTNLNPDEVVALGAAMQANALIKGNDEWLLLDVIPLSLGIETMGGLVEKIIERNSTIPISKAQEFTTYQDGQTSMRLHIVQGEREKVEDCRSLGSVTLENIPPMIAGMAKIQVTFSVDANGLLTVQALEKHSGNNTNIKIQPSYGLQEEDILAMLKESFIHAKQDIQKRMLAEETLNANQLIYACEQALNKDKNLIDSQQINQLHIAIQTLQNAIQLANLNNDSENLKIANEKFSETSQFFADIRMNKAIAQALGGKNINDI